ncbi:MAG: replication protein [Syntrophorhabdales bacterium]|jgi:phage replication O-like protein O
MAASPQCENGYTRLANEIIEALMKTNLSAYQSRVLWAIWRETYGYHKKADWISHTQLVEMTGIKKPHVSRTLSELIARNIVTRIGNKIAFCKDYQGWKELPKRVTVTNQGNKVTDWGYRRYQSGLLQKKKRVLKKDAPSPDVKVAIDYFFEAVHAKKGFKPEINGKDAALVKKSLEHGIDHVKAQIDFFLSNGKSQEHLTLAAALSADTYNLFMAKNGKKHYLDGVAY